KLKEPVREDVIELQKEIYLLKQEKLHLDRDQLKKDKEVLMRPRKPNWSTEQKLLLVQLVKARREGLLTGRHSCRETATNRRWAWDEIAEEISTAYPDVPRTGKECERHWFIEQAKAREALVSQKSPTEHINPVTKLVLEILKLQRKDTDF
ncbi:myb SANT-like DNA-binding domain-containing 4, partial [Clarias magur]